MPEAERPAGEQRAPNALRAAEEFAQESEGNRQQRPQPDGSNAKAEAAPVKKA